jgi:hypothetical protein
MMSLGGSQWLPRSSSTRSRFLYMPETQEKTRYKANNPMDKQVKLVVSICNNQQRYISTKERLLELLKDAKSLTNEARDKLTKHYNSSMKA